MDTERGASSGSRVGRWLSARRREPSLSGRLLLALAGGFLLVWTAFFGLLALSSLESATGDIDIQIMELVEAANATFDELPNSEAVRQAARSLAAVPRRQVEAQARRGGGNMDALR